MNAPRKLLLLLLILPAVLLAGCSDSDDPTDPDHWTLTIHNNTDTIYDIWQDTDLPGSDFALVGQVSSQSSQTLADRVIAVNYTFRLVPSGALVDIYDFEASVSSDGTDKSWTVP